MTGIEPKTQPAATAERGEFPPLRLGSLVLDPPVVLAPMAGVTNAPFRVLARSFGRALFVGEMISVRAFLKNHPKTLRLASFLPGERPRSIQCQAVSPPELEEAVRRLRGEGIEHLDLNLGCPVRKITASGGGAALPWKTGLLARLLRAFRRGAGSVPATVKMRLGIDDAHLTYLEAGRIAEAEGMDGVTLHARTAAQLYGGRARWEAIAELRSSLGIPVLGNGDVFEAEDALTMMRNTGAAGVVIGRGCLGRPWIFRELEALFAGRRPPPPPTAGEIREIALRHGALLVSFFGPKIGILHLRKHAAWYCKAFPGGAKLRDALVRANSLEEIGTLLARLSADLPYPPQAVRARRCKGSGTQRVSLPEGWLESRD